MAEELDKYIEKMEKSLDSLKNELNTIRTGRASASIFDKVRVNYYDTLTPLSQVATISIPEARQIVVQPWEKSLITEIEKGILKADLGLNPSNDGKVIRVTIPPLTAERRKDLTKQAKAIAEKFRVAIRNIRRDGNDAFKKAQKAGEITEDDQKTFEDSLQKATDKNIAEVDKIIAAKEKEIMEG